MISLSWSKWKQDWWKKSHCHWELDCLINSWFYPYHFVLEPVHVTKTSDDLDDRHRDLLKSSHSSLFLSTKWGGALLFRHLCTRTECLNLMHSPILSHWSSSRIRVEMLMTFWLAVMGVESRVGPLGRHFSRKVNFPFTPEKFSYDAFLSPPVA